MTQFSYQQALDFWHAHINYEQRSPDPGDLKLDRMHRLLRILGNPHESLRIVHVAGSKGKGSTSALIDSIARQAGLRSGLFTSPHLSRLEERFQIDGIPIPSDQVSALMTEIHDAESHLLRDGDIPLTFFEVATALGFLHFQRNNVDLAVMEVGLGGRFDSTNVCRPLVAIVTSISLDHTQQLGTTLARIAFEKAGIIKHGRPTVSGVRVTEARDVIENTCAERASPLRQIDRDIFATCKPAKITANGDSLARVSIRTDRQTWPDMSLPLIGDHQAVNAALAVACIEHLREEGLRIDDAAVQSGVEQVRWPARIEILQRRPMIVIDCAHNVASINMLMDTLRQSFPEFTRRRVLLGASMDKDLAGMVEGLSDYFHEAWFTRYSSSPRSASPADLMNHWRQITPKPCKVVDNALDCLNEVRAVSDPEDLVVITGSVFLAGEIREILQSKSQADSSN